MQTVNVFCAAFRSVHQPHFSRRPLVERNEQWVNEIIWAQWRHMATQSGSHYVNKYTYLPVGAHTQKLKYWKFHNTIWYSISRDLIKYPTPHFTGAIVGVRTINLWVVSYLSPLYCHNETREKTKLMELLEIFITIWFILRDISPGRPGSLIDMTHT